MNKVRIIGAGLAGSEAAWHLANRGIEVDLIEMKPEKKSPAHQLDSFGELVCSNSLRSNRIENAVGLLKEEMRILGSLVMEAAEATQVPAGGALAVDREGFSDYITEKLTNHDKIHVIQDEITELPEDGYHIIATGPLTSEALSSAIQDTFDSDDLFFYDAVAPIVDASSIDMEKAFKGSRYDRGDDYINCPMNEEEYRAFYTELINAKTADIASFEEKHVFEGCMPIESMAKRGYQTMAFGPLKPVGMRDPRTGKRPYAIVQLRQDDAAASMYNLVGFQTRLLHGEQKRVFSMIPGLEKARFLRYGVMHRNTYVNAPKLLTRHLMVKDRDELYFAGQITGVEGYVESAASGLWAGMSLANQLLGIDAIEPDGCTMMGAMVLYCTNPGLTKLDPMNANFGIIEPLETRVKGKRNRAEAYAKRGIAHIEALKTSIDNGGHHGN